MRWRTTAGCSASNNPDHCPWEWRDRFPAKDARERAFTVFDALADFGPVAWAADGFIKFPYFPFGEAAQEIFIGWSGDLHRTASRGGAPNHRATPGEVRQAVPGAGTDPSPRRVCGNRQRGPVTAEAALRAAAWCEYLEAHARRCYGLLTDDGLRAA